MLYRAKQVTQALEISQDRLGMWLKRGQVKASQPASGPGTRHKFSLEEVVRLAAFKELLEAGFTGNNASRIAFAQEPEFTAMIQRAITGTSNRTLLPELLSPAPVCWAAIEREGRVLVYGVESIESFARLYEPLSGAKLMHIVNLSKIAEGVKERLKIES